ncbi:MAG: redoxin domain-containing protein [Saprospiraceae bacterium]|nr:redoxin domain-containing protein [Saprospiraceae bacterium]
MVRFKTILFIVFAAFQFSSSAQTAPDFAITDSWGNAHQLYADYLDQGKTVLLKVFFVDCPPCNAIAPFMEPLYQKWGAGIADVQFIELSVLQSDSDTKINGYKANHNTTFPAVGGQGGGVAAVAPYKTNMFGQYTGTPTFVVIAPDRTVNYDVFGPNHQATIDALDEAIEATGATGLTTATENPETQLPLTLESNIINEVLVLKYQGQATNLNVSIVSVTGLKYTSARFPIDHSVSVRMNVGGLTQGTWILHVQDLTTRKVASYLFVKQ